MKGLCSVLLVLCAFSAAAYTRQDTLRGSNGRGRAWWDVQRYDLSFSVDSASRSIAGTNVITFKVNGAPLDSLQIDLQEPMEIDSITAGGQRLPVAREGAAFWISTPGSWRQGGEYSLVVSYHGKPREAVRPPWDGGFIWTKDKEGKPWVAVACQGLGASSWWPCKDYQGDEPDGGMRFYLPKETGGYPVSNGRLIDPDTVEIIDPVSGNILRTITRHDAFHWSVQNPINTYNVTFYLGDYVSWTDTFQGIKGTLNLSFNCLRYNEAKARKQFAVAKEMLRCFEWWLGPYPFYEDGYRLVEAPYLGMEHQSAVAYGNDFKMGYRGGDRSGTGVGLLFDYIIIHESGHEWFGNSITARDIADNWIHEGFTTYTETLFAEWIAGKAAARRYSLGERRGIENDRPIIGDYGVNDDGSGDKYDKGAAILHMIRTMMGDDAAFRQVLRGLNDTFYHKIVTTAQVEGYIARRAGMDLRPFFDQYLRTRLIPQLQWYRSGGKLWTRFVNTVDGFSLPLFIEGDRALQVPTGTAWSSVTWDRKTKPAFADDFLMETEEVKAPR